MDVKYINPFIEATIKILKGTTDIEANLGKLYIRNECFTANDVVIIIGVTGEIKGQVLFSISKEAMLHIASTMMKKMSGLEITEIDDMAKSAVSELANMILGNACMLLSKNNVGVNISPPSILIGENINISNEVPTVCVQLKLSSGNIFEINIAIKE